jgi:diketogulonate reductase-like aldo/keto reductase
MKTRTRRLSLVLVALATANGLAPIHRRDAIATTIGSAVTVIAPQIGQAEETTYERLKTTAETIDMSKIRAAQQSSSGGGGLASRSLLQSVIPSADPSPLLGIRGGKKGEQIVKIPRIGYSLYKTQEDLVPLSIALALKAGVTHFEVASLYGTNSKVGSALKPYLDSGLSALDVSSVKPEILEKIDSFRKAGEDHAVETGLAGLKSSLAPIPDGKLGRKGRRDRIFIHHKVSNEEQSTDATSVKRAVKRAIAELGCTYLDMVSIHSPLTDRSRRLATYKALLELRDSGFVRSVGVCNYGLGPLQEIEQADLELPAINQLELSPFNAHKDIVKFCSNRAVAVGCSSWSKLSSTPDIEKGWLDVVGKIAQDKGMTKAQVLVRWSLQHGYVCVPRSAAASKLEKIAIGENSYGGVNPTSKSFILSDEEITALDGLDVGLKTGTLGRRDGWGDNDVTGSSWDPTEYV